MDTYWVFTAPDNDLDPTAWHNGVEEHAESHLEAAQRRFAKASPAGVRLSNFWVAGPNQDGRLKLIRFKVRPTAVEVERSGP